MFERCIVNVLKVYKMDLPTIFLKISQKRKTFFFKVFLILVNDQKEVVYEIKIN